MKWTYEYIMSDGSTWVSKTSFECSGSALSAAIVGAMSRSESTKCGTLESLIVSPRKEGK